MAVLVVVIGVDASRALISLRASRRYDSAALAANALHFASDLAGSLAVLIGLVFVSAGYPSADAIAALLVAVLVVVAAVRLAMQSGRRADGPQLGGDRRDDSCGARRARCARRRATGPRTSCGRTAFRGRRRRDRSRYGDRPGACDGGRDRGRRP
jgi:hypothetical protein